MLTNAEIYFNSNSNKLDRELYFGRSLIIGLIKVYFNHGMGIDRAKLCDTHDLPYQYSDTGSCELKMFEVAVNVTSPDELIPSDV